MKITPCLAETCMETGKSFAASGGKKTSAAFLAKPGAPGGRAPGATSITCSLEPCAPFTAKVNSVDSDVAPSALNCANAAAWPSIGCETFFSTEKSCIAPMMRLVPGCAVEGESGGKGAGRRRA